MAKVLTFWLLIIVLFSFITCAAGPNEMANTENPQGNVAGFWRGWWHGFIALFTFVLSLFSDKIGVYEVYNNGGWYNFGFILGVMMFFGGSNGAGKKARSRKKE